MMEWIIKRLIVDLNARQGQWYWLGKNGTWTTEREKARRFAPLATAEKIASHFSGEAKVELY